MGMLARLLTGHDLMASTPGPTDDFWYRDAPGDKTPSGMRVDPESAKKLSAWYRGRDILATVLAMLPLQVFERLPNGGGSELARSNPLYDVVHDKPNVSQDSFQWRRQKMYHLIDHGNAYSRIISGRRGYVDQLEPIAPKLVTPVKQPGGRIIFYVRDPRTNITTPFTQDEIFHLRGASEDGVVGQGILTAARQSIGTALAVESYASLIFGNGTLNGGIIEVPGKLNDEASLRMARSFKTAAGDWAMPKVLEAGSKWTQSDMSPEDFQMLLSRKFSVDDMARWLGIPRQMLENNDPSFGNAEQFDRNFMSYSMGPWLSLWEFGINDQLVISNRFFVEFNRHAIVRSDIATQATADVQYVNAGIRSVDEVRAQHNWNARGGSADDLREPQNITGKPTAAPTQDPPAPNRRTDQASAIATASAARIIRKETSAVQALAKRFASDSQQFASGVSAFYIDHVTLVMQSLNVPREFAGAYCSRHAQQASGADWVAQVTRWNTTTYAAELASQALEITE